MQRISISHLAWKPQEDLEALQLLESSGIKYIEISPYRSWANLLSANESGLSYPDSLRKGNITIQAIQSLLYNQPELTIFTSKISREATARHLERMIDLAARLGIKVLVFGSPRNKLIGEMDISDAKKIAIDFFGNLAKRAAAKNIYFCLEPTPKEYGADFITTHGEVLELIKLIGSPGLKLNLDLGAARINNENCLDLIHSNLNDIGHIHISEPFLKSIILDIDFHTRVAKTLTDLRYTNGISIEQLALESPNLNIIKDVLSFVKKIYG